MLEANSQPPLGPGRRWRVTEIARVLQAALGRLRCCGGGEFALSRRQGKAGGVSVLPGVK